MSTMLTPDVTAYLQMVALPTTNELTLYERVAATLKNLRPQDEASRKSGAASLLSLQKQIAQLAGMLHTIRPPLRLTSAHDKRVSAVKHMAAAAAEVANGLSAPASSRRQRFENARKEAEAAEGSMRSGADAITASIGAAGASVAATPVVGPIIAAVLMAIAAIIMLIAQIVAGSHEDKAAKKENPAQPARKDDD